MNGRGLGTDRGGREREREKDRGTGVGDRVEEGFKTERDTTDQRSVCRIMEKLN